MEPASQSASSVSQPVTGIVLTKLHTSTHQVHYRVSYFFLLLLRTTPGSFRVYTTTRPEYVENFKRLDGDALSIA